MHLLKSQNCSFPDQEDPLLEDHRRNLICNAAQRLDKAKMIRFDENTGYLCPTDLGRVASNFYIKYDTVEVIAHGTDPIMATLKIKH